MKIQSKVATHLADLSYPIIVGINTDLSSSEQLASLGQINSDFFSQANILTNLPQKAGEIRTFYNVPEVAATAISVIAHDNTKKSLINTAQKITKHLRSERIEQAAILLTLTDFTDNDNRLSPLTAASLLSKNLVDSDYHCDTYKSEKKERQAISVDILCSEENATIEQGIKQGLAIGSGMNLLKDLGNAPGNICTPRYLANVAKQLGDKFDSLSVDILKEKDIKALKMGALLSVSKGSIEKPRLIKIQHKGSQDDPIILVGKGVTFDTGGISLKPGAGMDEMKYDMCGAGSVIGTMKTIAMLNLPINVIGIIPAVENMPSDRATKPGDIVTSMSGKTIEVLNTDAEGRMILCDALTYAQQFKPKALIDIATLTGAVIIGLGRHPSGLMSNSDQLAAELTAAGESSGDRVWRLPVWEEYVEQLESPFADLQNIGGRDAGTITAGCFLGEFTKDCNWAHLDIAGTAWKTRKKGATGRPVPLLVQYVLSQVK